MQTMVIEWVKEMAVMVSNGDLGGGICGGGGGVRRIKNDNFDFKEL